ncbi:DUF4365 domain-containing protein [Arenibacter algicola]|uniref:DUF4365 domain-containing protein n=1 Tax=Arenibacter algicola TaxID=616991 RepID=UPI001C074CE6|nr:DUF4365 domain-containing protein [Arenibacter algicola]MBU2905111.1 DUF4365 domain-containing protein [Arenibacter algicola]
MITYKQRQITKNEATGMRVVSQFVQEFWECGWQPFEQRNDCGIDGVIILKKRGTELGVRINVQVKCGGGYISSLDNETIKFKFKSKPNLEKHIKYWKKQIEPAVLIFINPGDRISNNQSVDTDKVLNQKTRLNPEAWWVDLKSTDLKTEGIDTLINIPLNQKFGEHSKGDFIKLCSNLIHSITYPRLHLENDYKKILIGDQQKSRDFFKRWKSENNGLCYCLALRTNIIISNVAWKHITSKKRGTERITYSLKSLGIAKQIVEQVEFYTTFNQRKTTKNYTVSKIGIKAHVETKEQKLGLIQVVLNVRDDLYGNRKVWLYSIHQIK